jgi:hypothetical protein
MAVRNGGGCDSPRESAVTRFDSLVAGLDGVQFNLLVGDEDWLVLRFWPANGRFRAFAALQVRWDGRRPVALDDEVATASRRQARAALRRLQDRWRHGVPASGRAAELRDAGFRFALRLVNPAYRAAVTDEHADGSDVAVALPGESIDEILRRMSCRCRPRSLIARRRSGWGRPGFQVMAVSPPGGSGADRGDHPSRTAWPR